MDSDSCMGSDKLDNALTSVLKMSAFQKDRTNPAKYICIRLVRNVLFLEIHIFSSCFFFWHRVK